jgi:hypothetical protein
VAAYVVKITEDNLRGVIRSEAGPNYDLDAALDWFNEHGEGWFLRDEETVLDCQFFVPDILTKFYKFTNVDDHSLFRRVIPV